MEAEDVANKAKIVALETKDTEYATTITSFLRPVKMHLSVPGTTPKLACVPDGVTEYKVLQKYRNYTLIEVVPKTGRKHQIRTHLSFLDYPIAGDKVYGFKNQQIPKGLERQFLHASYLKIKLPNNKEKEIKSKLPKNLKEVLNNLKWPQK